MNEREWHALENLKRVNELSEQMDLLIEETDRIIAATKQILADMKAYKLLEGK